MPFKALWVTETKSGTFERNIVDRKIDDLPSGEIVIRVHYSSLNYKDALSATGNKGITREFPHTPGIDAAGVVEISRNELFACRSNLINGVGASRSVEFHIREAIGRRLDQAAVFHYGDGGRGNVPLLHHRLNEIIDVISVSTCGGDESQNQGTKNVPALHRFLQCERINPAAVIRAFS